MGNRRDPSSRAISAANRGLAGLAGGSDMPATVSAWSGPAEKGLRNILLTFAVSRSTVKGSAEFADRFDAKNVA